jgi:hypothetical protein
MRKALLVSLAIVTVALAFIASYSAALRSPTPHEVPIAVSRDVPNQVVDALDRSPALKVTRTDDPQSAIDRREAYGALTATQDGLRLTTAPAASAGVATLLADEVPKLLPGKVALATTHPLAADDNRGLIGTYTVIGWVIAGYLGATLFGMTFGTRGRLALRLGALAGVALAVGLGGALLAKTLGGLPGPWLGLSLLGALIVASVGAVTVALQAFFGIAGTGIAILLFVVLGNPSSGGLAAPELLPAFWREIGQAIPVGAGVTAFRDAAYFPAASLVAPLVTLALWAVAGVAAALLQAAASSGAARRRLSASSSRWRMSRGLSRRALAVSDGVDGLAPERP